MIRSDRLADDGAARHLKKGALLPARALLSTTGIPVDLAAVPGWSVVFFYPWTGRPGQPNPPDWDDIPGAHGSTPQAQGFRDLIVAFQQIHTRIFGVSTQPSDYQRELVDRLQLPYELLSDEGFALQKALALPTFETGGVTYLKRLTLCLKDGRIQRVYYPISHPAAHAREVCAGLGMADRSQ